MKEVFIYIYNMEINPGPPTQQGATLTNYKNKLYLYGGKGSLMN